MNIFQDVAGHQVTRNAVALMVLQVANYIIPFLVLVRLTQVLGVTTYGIVAFSIALVQFGLVFLDFGFGLAATQKISTIRGNKKYVSRYIGAIYSIKIIMFLFVSIVIICYSSLSRKYSDHFLLMLLSLIPLLSQGFQPDWFFSGIERMRNITVITIMGKVVYVVLIYLFVRGPGDYLFIPLANGISQTIATVIGIVLIYKHGYYISFPHFRDFVFAVRSASGFFISRLSVTLYMSSNVLLMGFIAPADSVAAYSFAEQLYRVMQSVFSPVVQALYPYMAKAKRLDILLKTALACVAIAAIGAISGFFLAPFLIGKIFGDSWISAMPVLRVFLVAIIVNVAASFAGYPLAAALGRLRVANVSVVCGSLVYLALAGTLILAGIKAPAAFAMTMIVAETYVLAHRGIVLFPQAIKGGRSQAVAATE